MFTACINIHLKVASLLLVGLAIFAHHCLLVDATMSNGLSPISILISSMSSGSKCCGSRYPRMKPHYSTGSAIEAFDDGTPLSFYRQQVAKLYGGGGGGGGGGHGGNGGGKKMPSIGQLYKNSFGYQSMLMGGGFMKSDGGFGPAGTSTSKKWRGYGRGLLAKAKSGGGGYGGGGDRLNNVHVVASGASDEYKDSYVTMIANTVKRTGGY